MNEEWRPVVGWENRYEVSNLGLIKVLPHDTVNPIGVTRSFPGRLLKPTTATSGGYQQVHLSHGRKRVTALVHSLVLEAFVGPRPEGMHGCHWDGDPTNNNLKNLRWDTPAGNAADMSRHNRHRNGRLTHCKHGHPFDEANTRTDSKGHRFCRTCCARWGATSRARRKARKNNEH